ncbi:hypothetical protein [[Kitasatospora] papulosa]|uniref:hypothetical protein n=1 Tax=[Kitasatospora] papulosa TaxID=1464011 RepID=UPI0036A94CD4
MTNEAPEQRDQDVRDLDQQPAGLARCAPRPITRSVANLKKLIAMGGRMTEESGRVAFDAEARLRVMETEG